MSQQQGMGFYRAITGAPLTPDDASHVKSRFGKTQQQMRAAVRERDALRKENAELKAKLAALNEGGGTGNVR